MNDNPKLLNYLKKLDLTDIESQFYLTLLNTGSISVRELAQITGIKRTTSYLYIDQLVEKGLAMKLVKSSKKQVAATPPEQIQYLIEKKLEKTKSLHQEFPDIIKTLNTIQPRSIVGDAEIKYFKGQQSLAKIFQEALKSNELCLYNKLSQVVPIYPINQDMFEQGLKRNPKLEIYEIYGDPPEKIKNFNYKANSPRYHYKFMPPSIGLTTPGILHYDNKVAIINIKGKLSVTVLHDKDYYDNSRKLFNFIWSILPEPNY